MASRHLTDYVYQVCISWKLHNVPTNDIQTAMDFSSSDRDRVQATRTMAQDWAEPFQSFVSLISDCAHVKLLRLDDFQPSDTLTSTDQVLLLGDASHAMTMCKSAGTSASLGTATLD